MRLPGIDAAAAQSEAADHDRNGRCVVLRATVRRVHSDSIADGLAREREHADRRQRRALDQEIETHKHELSPRERTVSQRRTPSAEEEPGTVGAAMVYIRERAVARRRKPSAEEEFDAVGAAAPTDEPTSYVGATAPECSFRADTPRNVIVESLRRRRNKTDRGRDLHRYGRLRALLVVTYAKGNPGLKLTALALIQAAECVGIQGAGVDNTQTVCGPYSGSIMRVAGVSVTAQRAEAEAAAAEALRAVKGYSAKAGRAAAHADRNARYSLYTVDRKKRDGAKGGAKGGA